MNLGYSGEVALVTGGTRGIGLAIARALLAEGCRVAVVGRTPVPAEGLSQLFGESASRVLALQADLAAQASAADIVTRTAARFGHLDILVNNASTFSEATVLGSRNEDWESLFQTKLFGYVRTTRAAVEYLERSGVGAIINISGIAGVSPRVHAAHASAGNAGILSLTATSARELAPKGIRVNAITPGAARTARFQARVDTRMAGTGERQEEAERALLAASPTGRAVDPDEIGLLAVMMCSPRLKSLVGANVIIDGGLTT